MSDQNEPTARKRYRMPIILGIVAVLLYLSSIVWMVYSSSQAG